MENLKIPKILSKKVLSFKKYDKKNLKNGNILGFPKELKNDKKLTKVPMKNYENVLQSF